MDYSLLEGLGKTELRRTVGGLERLREQLEAIPAKDSEENLLLATWNIRDLGKPDGGWGYGERLPESYFYIAEILSRFDFVAVQEVNELWAWEKVMQILGPHWGYVASDVTPEELGGNDERLVYLYDTRKVSFRNVVGEIVLPPSMLISKHVFAKPGDKPKLKKNQLLTSGRQFARTPYFASFQAGWRKFDICTVHIYYGSEGGEELERRIEEIRQIATFLAKRAKESVDDGRALVLLGDFNVVGLEHETMKALTDSGFVVPEIREPPGSTRNSFYDQIAFMTPQGVLDHLDDGVGGDEESGQLSLLPLHLRRGRIRGLPQILRTGARRDRTAKRQRRQKRKARNRRNQSSRSPSTRTGAPGSSPTTSRSGCACGPTTATASSTRCSPPTPKAEGPRPAAGHAAQAATSAGRLQLRSRNAGQLAGEALRLEPPLEDRVGLDQASRPAAPRRACRSR